MQDLRNAASESCSSNRGGKRVKLEKLIQIEHIILELSVVCQPTGISESQVGAQEMTFQVGNGHK